MQKESNIKPDGIKKPPPPPAPPKLHSNNNPKSKIQNPKLKVGQRIGLLDKVYKVQRIRDNGTVVLKYLMNVPISAIQN